MTYCSECGCETGRRIWINGRLFCNMCAEMWLAVHNSAWLLRCHNAWVEEVKNVQRLRLGADYFG